MNYSALFSNLRKEIFTQPQYKNLNPGARVLAVIAAIPFILCYLSLLLSAYVTIFAFNCLASSVDYLEGWVKETKKDINQWTEPVLYFVTMPQIFFMRSILSAFSISFYILWFYMMCFAYIATFGGIRWQPFISYAQFDEGIEIKHTTAPGTAKRVTVTAGVLYILMFLMFIVGAIAEESAFFTIGGIVGALYILIMLFIVPAVFKKEIIRTAAVPAARAVSAGDFDEEFPEI